MKSDRLNHIEKQLAILRKQQATLEQEALLYSGLPKVRAEQQIEEEIRPKILEYEQEYRHILVAASERLEITEPEAETVIAEFVEGVHQLETQPTNPQLAEVLDILHELRDKANEPDKPATLKVKGMISTFPPFVGVFVEPEIDAENFWRQHFPTFTRLLKGAVKK